MASNVNSAEEYDFVEKPGKVYFCPVTFELLKDPRQTNLCCGNHLSRTATELLEAEGKPCPLCKKVPLKTTEDLFFKRKVMELKVRCSNKAAGCQWVGSIRDLENYHLKLGSSEVKCDFVTVKCPLACDEHIHRRHLQQHISEECLKRWFTCKYCDYQSTYERVFIYHWPKCQRYPLDCPNKCSTAKIERQLLQQHLIEDCPLQERECEFSHAGCKRKMTRQSMNEHLEECKDEHLKMTSAKCRKLETEIKDIKYALIQIAPRPVFIQPPEIIMSNFGKNKNDDTDWYSPGFSTHVGGYKMCIRVDANGQGNGKGTHVGLFVYMMKGEFDSHLKWPFKGEITVELVNQKEGGDNLVKKPLEHTHPDECKRYFRRVTDGDIAKSGWGFSQFIAHSELYKPEEDKEYLLNDSLILKVTNVEVTSM